MLERIRAEDTSAYLRRGAEGAHVREVQNALIDVGYSIPDGGTGFFGDQTSAAVVQFKTDQQLTPNDAVVGVGTITALDNLWAMPFADRDEFLQGQVRPIPEFNFTRRNELDRLLSAQQFTFSPLSAWLPDAFQSALLMGITALLDPGGSPAGSLTPSATWGASPLDLYHCHVVIDKAHALTPSWDPLLAEGRAIDRRAETMGLQAQQHGPIGSPSWTMAYRDRILAAGPAGASSYSDQLAHLLNGLLANSFNEHQTLKIVWHTFESPLWRPIDVDSNHLRRSWWNDVAPIQSGVTRTPFNASDFSVHVFHLAELAFFIDHDLVVTVHGQTRVEAGALADVSEARIKAAIDGLPFP